MALGVSDFIDYWSSDLCVRSTAVTLPSEFGDLHRRAVSSHFQLLAAISDGGYAASVFGINVEYLDATPFLHSMLFVPQACILL